MNKKAKTPKKKAVHKKTKTPKKSVVGNKTKTPKKKSDNKKVKTSKKSDNKKVKKKNGSNKKKRKSKRRKKKHLALYYGMYGSEDANTLESDYEDDPEIFDENWMDRHKAKGTEEFKGCYRGEVVKICKRLMMCAYGHPKNARKATFYCPLYFLGCPQQYLKGGSLEDHLWNHIALGELKEKPFNLIAPRGAACSVCDRRSGACVNLKAWKTHISVYNCGGIPQPIAQHYLDKKTKTLKEAKWARDWKQSHPKRVRREEARLEEEDNSEDEEDEDGDSEEEEEEEEENEENQEGEEDEEEEEEEEEKGCGKSENDEEGEEEDEEDDEEEESGEEEESVEEEESGEKNMSDDEESDI